MKKQKTPSSLMKGTKAQILRGTTLIFAKEQTLSRSLTGPSVTTYKKIFQRRRSKAKSTTANQRAAFSLGQPSL